MQSTCIIVNLNFSYGAIMTRILSTLTLATLLTACAGPGQVGDECTSDADCADDLECHMHEGETDHGDCEEHEEGEHEEGEETASE